jgi:hypothetical protein
MTICNTVPLYVAQLVLLKINSQSPAYIILTFVNNYVSAICAVFATSIHSLSCVTRGPWLIVFYSLEHRDLVLAAIDQRQLRRQGELVVLPEIRYASG